MKINIRPITLPLPYKMGSVNCYLVQTKTGFILIDTGCSGNREELMHELESAGCKPDKLKLIVLTHGDFDHSGNAAFLRDHFQTHIAMHYYDAVMVETGDMFINRGNTNFLVRKSVPFLFGFGKSERFKPDIYLREGSTLTDYGLNAKVIHLPGHSIGSIGVLIKTGDLIGGDLFENIKQPSLDSMIDDMKSAKSSVKKLSNYPVGVVFPGHGQPFNMAALELESLTA